MKSVLDGTARWAVEQGDCLDVLRALPPGSVDAVVTDPPYGIKDAAMVRRGKYGARGDNTWHPPSNWDAAIDPAWCAEVCRIAPIVAWFGHWRKREEVASAMPHALRCEIVWAKDTHVGFPCPAAMRDERIWIFSRSGLKPRRFETTVWDEKIIPTWAHKHHKNEKPERLMRRLATWLVSPNGLVLDPFAGSGTTGVAAIREGFRFIGIEREAQYVEIARKRIAEAAAPAQPSLRGVG